MWRPERPSNTRSSDDGTVVFVAANVPGLGYKTFKVTARDNDPVFRRQRDRHGQHAGEQVLQGDLRPGRQCHQHPGQADTAMRRWWTLGTAAAEPIRDLQGRRAGRPGHHRHPGRQHRPGPGLHDRGRRHDRTGQPAPQGHPLRLAAADRFRQRRGQRARRSPTWRWDTSPSR